MHRLFESYEMVASMGGIKMLISNRLFVLVKLTNRCNQNCKHCVTLANENEATDLDISIIDSLLKSIRRIDEHAVVSFIGGEATVWPYFYEMLNLKSFKAIQNKKLNTNATALDNSKIRAIAEAGFFEVRISIDSDSPYEHDLLRGEGTFDVALENTKKMLQKDIPITSGLVVHKRNLHRIDTICAFLHKIGVQMVHMFPYVEKGRGGSQDGYAITQEDESALHKHIKSVYPEFYRINKSKCKIGTAYIKIHEDGDCIMHFAEKNCKSVYVGNLYEERFENLYDKALNLCQFDQITCTDCIYECDVLDCENMHNYCTCDMDFRDSKK